MVSHSQAIYLANAFLNDACEAMDISVSTISLSEIANLPPLYGVPQHSAVNPSTREIVINSAFVDNCCRRNSFTPLRVEIYACVRKIFLLLNPDVLQGRDLIMESLYYANALVALKGLQIPMPSEAKDVFFSNVQRVLKDEFNMEATFLRTPAKPFNGDFFYKAHLSNSCTQRYVNRYCPMPAKTTVKKMKEGDRGTKSNPFVNVYDAVEFIKHMEMDAHDADVLLQDIEQQKFFYDPCQGHFRIHWASPFVSQYVNNSPTHSFFVNQMDTGFFSLKPNLYRHKFLYRGQSDHYEGKPCVPNLFRSEKHNADRNYLEFLIFSQEMELLIQSHPLVRLLEGGVELLHDTFRFRMNYSGLTQHYYNKSRFLDFSSDVEVMKFFATTDYDSNSDTYSPHIQTDGLGVIYCYELQYPTAFHEHKGYALKTIGKQPFVRPGAQCGFLLDMDKDVDLKTLPEVTSLYFKHDPAISKEFFKRSHNGEDYFATDLLQHAWHDRLCSRKNNRVVSRQTVEYNAKLNHTTPENITAKLVDINIKVDDFELIFSEEELDIYYDEIKNKNWWSRFCDDIHFYGPEDELYRQALKDIQYDARYTWAFVK